MSSPSAEAYVPRNPHLRSIWSAQHDKIESSVILSAARGYTGILRVLVGDLETEGVQTYVGLRAECFPLTTESTPDRFSLTLAHSAGISGVTAFFNDTPVIHGLSHDRDVPYASLRITETVLPESEASTLTLEGINSGGKATLLSGDREVALLLGSLARKAVPELTHSQDSVLYTL